MTDDNRKVKDLLDPQARADLERWFALPSFDQLAEEQQQATPPEEDPDVVAVRERRARAIAEIDPQLLATHLARIAACESCNVFAFTLSSRVAEIGVVGRGLLERQLQIGEPREVEIPPELEDDLKECTPQAILRDLHRVEEDFEKTFEVHDLDAEHRFDIVAEVRTAMATRHTVAASQLGPSPFHETRALLAELRAERRRPWPTLLATANLPNRRVEPLGADERGLEARAERGAVCPRLGEEAGRR